MKVTFAELQEAAYASEDKPAITLLVALEDASRDALNGETWKSDIPSEATILEAFLR